MALQLTLVDQFPFGLVGVTFNFLVEMNLNNLDTFDLYVAQDARMELCVLEATGAYKHMGLIVHLT